MPIKRVIEPARTTEQIERDLALTRARIDATLDAMQEKLKPASLARDAAKSIVGGAGRKVRNAVKRLQGRGASPDSNEELPLTLRVPEGKSPAPVSGPASTAIVMAVDAASMLMKTRRKSAAKIRKTALTVGAAAGAAGIAGAIAATAIRSARKRSKAKAAAKKPKSTRSKVTKSKTRKKAAWSKRGSTKRSRSK